MSDIVLSWFPPAALVVCVAAPALAEPATVTVWYRSAEGCPDASAFIQRVQTRVPQARLAQAGDRIDFVVTLGVGASSSTGRLERQTKAGTVAIRELDDESCQQVADALALNVALAAQPDASDAAREARAPPQLSAVENTGSDTPLAEKPTAVSSAAPSRVAGRGSVGSLHGADAATDSANRTEREARPGWWLVGAELSGAIGVASQPMPGASVYVEREFVGILGGSSLRLAPLGAWSVAALDGFRVWIAAGRLEGCALRVPIGRFEFRPCVAWDLGAIGANGAGATGADDTGLWSAIGGSGRLRWLVTERWIVEADVGVFAPLTRYAFVSDAGQTLHEGGAVGASAAIGTGMRLP